MHYSYYLRTSHKPPVSLNSPARETYVEPELKIEHGIVETKLEVTQQPFPQVDPDKIGQIWVSQENAPPSLNTNVDVHYKDPLLADIHQFLMSASKSDIVTKQNTRKLIKYLVDCLKGSMEEASTILTEDEANDIMIFLTRLQDEYFEDIPLTENPSRLFIWNIPYDMYKGMMDSINAGEPDILNPMTTLYLSMTDFPKEATARYHQILDTMRYGHENDIRKFADEYLKQMDDGSEGESTLEFDEEDE